MSVNSILTLLVIWHKQIAACISIKHYKHLSYLHGAQRTKKEWLRNHIQNENITLKSAMDPCEYSRMLSESGSLGVTSPRGSRPRASLMNRIRLLSFSCLWFCCQNQSSSDLHKGFHAYGRFSLKCLPSCHWRGVCSCCPLSRQGVLCSKAPMSPTTNNDKPTEEAIRWSQGHSCQWCSVLCSSSGASEEWAASSSPRAVARPPPAAWGGPRQGGWTHVWVLRKVAGSFRCCCDSSSEEEGGLSQVWARRSKAPGSDREFK